MTSFRSKCSKTILHRIFFFRFSVISFAIYKAHSLSLTGYDDSQIIWIYCCKQKRWEKNQHFLCIFHLVDAFKVFVVHIKCNKFLYRPDFCPVHSEPIFMLVFHLIYNHIFSSVCLFTLWFVFARWCGADGIGLRKCFLAKIEHWRFHYIREYGRLHNPHRQPIQRLSITQGRILHWTQAFVSTFSCIWINWTISPHYTMNRTLQFCFWWDILQGRYKCNHR